MLLLFVLAGAGLVAYRFSTPWPIAAGVGFGVAAGALLVIGRYRRHPGRVLLSCWLSLLGLGVVWTLRLKHSEVDLKSSILVLLALGVLAAGLIAPGWARLLLRIPARVLALGGVLLIGLPLLTWSRQNNAFIAVQMPFVGSVQPAELGRVLLLIWLARAVEHRRPQVVVGRSRWGFADPRVMLYTTVPLLAGVAVAVVSNDLGPALILAVVTVVVVACAGLPWRNTAWAAAAGVACALAAVRLSSKVAGRLTMTTNPIPADGDITQVGLGLVMMAHGPTGLGRGTPWLIPRANDDLLLAAIGHELGAGTVVTIVMLWIAVAAAGWSLIRRDVSAERQLLLTAMLSSLLLQTLMMGAAVLGVAPLTGMPLPFVAMSGSNLLSSALAGSLVLALADIARHDESSPGWTTITKRSVGVMIVAAVLALLLVGRDLVLMTQTKGILEQARGRDPYAALVARVALPTLVTTDGVVIATTTSNDAGTPRLTTVERSYPAGLKYAPLLGSAFRPGLEARLATTNPCGSADHPDLTACGVVKLTLLDSVQTAAVDAMRGKTGSVIAVDVQSGAVLAYVSIEEGKVAEGSRDRVRSELIAPGSVAKVATASAAIQNGLSTSLKVADSFTPPGGSAIRSPSGPCGGSLPAAMAASCNPYFASLGAQLGAARLASTTEPWLNGQRSITSMGIARSVLVASTGTPAQAASGAIGMGDAQVTPLALASLTAQVARRGEPVCLTLARSGPKSDCTAQATMSRTTADQIAQAMRSVVTSGTASKVPGLAALGAAAKTGTADYQAQMSNATFIAFAPADAPRVAVVVIVEPGPVSQQSGLVGSRDAGPVAVSVLRAALDR